MIRALILSGLLLVPAIQGADEKTEVTRRYQIGGRVQAFPLQLFTVKTVETSTTQPIADYKYTSTTDSQRATLTPTFEFRLKPRLTIGTDFMLHHANYVEKQEIRTGKKDPNASTDDRKVTTITQTTKANYWELPVLVRYYGLRGSGILKRSYAIGGFGFRHIGRVRTGNEYSYADDTTDYNEAPAQPSRKNQFGAVAGFGIRFVDDFNIKVMPEVRYTRWAGFAFEGKSYKSVQNELRVGLGISF
jgi:hypothetical protein